MPKLDEFADSHIAQRFSTVNGVAQVQVFGSQKYAVRLFVDPERAGQAGTRARQGGERHPGSELEPALGCRCRAQSRNYTVKSDGKLERAADFNSLIVAYKDGQPVRFQDIGRAEDSVENEKIRSWHNGERALLLAIYRQPGSNTVEVVSQLRDLLPEIEREMPAGASLSVLVDRSEFIRDSIHEVNFTLVLSMALVIGVILVFLRNLRATLVTALVLPASVLGTFAVMSLLGLQSEQSVADGDHPGGGFRGRRCHRGAGEHHAPHGNGQGPAGRRADGAKEIGFTVVTMTVSLSAVFLPILFMEGMVGRLFREFAVTVGVAVLISGVVSLTITPMMCSLLLKADHEHGRLFRWSENVFNWARDAYGASLRFTLRHSGSC